MIQEEFTKANGKKTSDQVSDMKSLRMATSTTESFYTAKHMGMESTHGLMERYSKVSGSMG